MNKMGTHLLLNMQFRHYQDDWKEREDLKDFGFGFFSELRFDFLETKVKLLSFILTLSCILILSSLSILKSPPIFFFSSFFGLHFWVQLGKMKGMLPLSNEKERKLKRTSIEKGRRLWNGNKERK